MITFLTIKQCKRLCLDAPTVSPVKRAKPEAVPVRMVEWHPCGQYRALNTKARCYASIEAIIDAHTAGTLSCEADFWEFCHIDDKVVRGDKFAPRFLALFRLTDGRYIVPQSKHYKQAYANDGRKNAALADSLLAGGRPYWCCIYAIRVKSEQASKKKYQQRQRNGRL